MRSVGPALVALGLVVVGGCGDDDSTSPSPEPAAADKTAAESLVLQLGDLPVGWRTIADGPRAAQVGACQPVATALERRSGEATARFRQEDGPAGVSNTVTLWPTTSMAENYLKAWEDPALADCAAKAAERHLTETLGTDPAFQPFEVLHVGFERLPSFSIGEGSTGQRISSDIHAGDTNARVIGDYVVIRVGRVTAGFEFGNIDAPLADPRDRMISAVVGRLENFDR